MVITFFDWRWNDEEPKSIHQLTVERNLVSGFYRTEGEYLIYKNDEGFDGKFPLNLELKNKFIEKYSDIDATEIDSFLEYHFNLYQEKPTEFLKYVRAIILSMPILNDFELNPEGKKVVGLVWVKEMIGMFDNSNQKKKRLPGAEKKSSERKLKLEDIFNKSKITKEFFFQRLKLYGFIDENENWKKSKSDMLGLMRFLIEETSFINLNKYALLQKILATEIHFEEIKVPSQSVKGHYIDQYKRVFSIQ